MEKLPIWSEECTVRFNAVDRSDLMTLNAVFAFFQEAAISHAENLGVGREAMEKANQVWILSRISVVVDRRPKYGETVTVRTWPRGGEKLFALRDFDIRDREDKPAVRARSCWLIIDMEKRRPLRPLLMDGLPQNEGLDALSSAANLKECPSLGIVTERPALYGDVDYNGHVNNVSYIRWIEDTVAPGLLEQAGRMRFDINYLNEILPGDVTGVWAAPVEDTGEGGAGVTDTPPFYAFAFEGRKIENEAGPNSFLDPRSLIHGPPKSGQAAFRAELRLWR